MPDDNNNAAGAGQSNDNGAGENNGNTGAEGANNTDNTGATDTGNDDAGAGEGQNNGNDNAGDHGDNGASDDKNKKDNQPADDGQEPEVRPRKSAKDFIIQRQQKRIANLAKKGNQNNEGGDDNNSDDDDDEIAPEDEEMITKVVAKRFAPVIEKLLAAEDESEIQNFLKENPDFKPYEAKARRFIQHPSRRQLPIKSVFYEVAGDQLIKIGADRQKQADDKAKQTHTGGGSNRSAGGEGTKPVWELPKDEFEAKQEKIRRGQ